MVLAGLSCYHNFEIKEHSQIENISLDLWFLSPTSVMSKVLSFLTLHNSERTRPFGEIYLLYLVSTTEELLDRKVAAPV
jgi:hypothetical protein